MKLVANWRGTLARLGERTADGRVLAPSIENVAATVAVPGALPVLFRTVGRSGLGPGAVRIGTIAAVSSDQRELTGVGTLDLRATYFAVAEELPQHNQLFVAADFDRVALHPSIEGLLTHWRLRSVVFSLGDPGAWEKPCVAELDWRELP